MSLSEDGKPRWSAKVFMKAFGLDDVQYRKVRKLMKEALQQDELLGAKMNTTVGKDNLDSLVDSFSPPQFLIGKKPEAELKEHLKELARRISFNERRWPTSDPPGPTAGPEASPSVGVQDPNTEPATHQPTVQHADAKPVTHRPTYQPTHQLTEQHLDTGLAACQLMVRGFDDGDESTCNVTDILAEPSHKKNLADLSVDDLDYERWVGYLEEDISFDRETQFLVFDNPTGIGTISVKNERSWRAAVRVALKSDKGGAVFSVKEGKFFLSPPPKTGDFG